MIRTARLFTLIFLSLITAGLLRAQNDCFKDWAYVRTVNVNNVTGGGLLDHQVRLSINTQALIAASKMKPDGSDIRFTLSDCCTELPVWIQSGINTTIVWTRVPSIPASGAVQLRIYYGNPNAPVVEHIDSVMFNMGNDLTGTGPLMSGVTITTQRDTFPIPTKTVRWRIYSGDTARFRLKVANDTNMVTSSSPYFTTPPTPGFYYFDWEGQCVAGGFPGFYSADTMQIMNSCAPAMPCPGSCGDLTYANADLVTFGALDSVTCGAFPSLRVWYRRSAFLDPFVSLTGTEFHRHQAFPASLSGASVLCPGDSALITAQGIGATTYQWYLDGVAIPGAIDTALVVYQEGNYTCVANFGTCRDVFSDTIGITINQPSLNFGRDVTLCTDSSVTLDAGPGFSSYLWSDGSTTQTLVVNASGDYWVQITDTAGCTASDSISLTLHPLPDPVILPSGPVMFCEGDSVMLDAFNTNWYSYYWSQGGATSSNILVTTPGDYYVKVVDMNGCEDSSATVNVSHYPQPVLDLGPDHAFCDGDSVVLSTGTGWASVLWAWGYTGTDYTATFGGAYLASVVDSNGCTDSDTVVVEIFGLPAPQIGPGATVCAGETWPLDAGSGYSQYLWSNGDTTQVIAAGEGGYTVTVTDANGCVAGSNSINIFEYPALNYPVINGNEEGLTSSEVPNYQWNLNGSPIPGATASTLVPDSTGEYTVTTLDPNGCDTLTSNVIYIDIVRGITENDIPEGFSPNGDGINDFFTVLNIGNFPSNSLKVMNRWGQQVYLRQPYDNGFNGRSDQGVDLPDGTYFYILDLGNGETPFSGYLIINR